MEMLRACESHYLECLVSTATLHKTGFIIRYKIHCFHFRVEILYFYLKIMPWCQVSCLCISWLVVITKYLLIKCLDSQMVHYLFDPPWPVPDWWIVHSFQYFPAINNVKMNDFAYTISYSHSACLFNNYIKTRGSFHVKIYLLTQMEYLVILSSHSSW